MIFPRDTGHRVENLKIVRGEARPVCADSGLLDIRQFAKSDERAKATKSGARTPVDIFQAYIDHIASVADAAMTLQKLHDTYSADALDVDDTDGYSFEFAALGRFYKPLLQVGIIFRQQRPIDSIPSVFRKLPVGRTPVAAQCLD